MLTYEQLKKYIEEIKNLVNQETPASFTKNLLLVLSAQPIPADEEVVNEDIQQALIIALRADLVVHRTLSQSLTQLYCQLQDRPSYYANSLNDIKNYLEQLVSNDINRKFINSYLDAIHFFRTNQPDYFYNKGVKEWHALAETLDDYYVPYRKGKFKLIRSKLIATWNAANLANQLVRFIDLLVENCTNISNYIVEEINFSFACLLTSYTDFERIQQSVSYFKTLGLSEQKTNTKKLIEGVYGRIDDTALVNFSDSFSPDEQPAILNKINTLTILEQNYILSHIRVYTCGNQLRAIHQRHEQYQNIIAFIDGNSIYSIDQIYGLIFIPDPLLLAHPIDHSDNFIDIIINNNAGLIFSDILLRSAQYNGDPGFRPLGRIIREKNCISKAAKMNCWSILAYSPVECLDLIAQAIFYAAKYNQLPILQILIGKIITIEGWCLYTEHYYITHWALNHNNVEMLTLIYEADPRLINYLPSKLAFSTTTPSTLPNFISPLNFALIENKVHLDTFLALLNMDGLEFNNSHESSTFIIAVNHSSPEKLRALIRHSGLKIATFYEEAKIVARDNIGMLEVLNEPTTLFYVALDYLRDNSQQQLIINSLIELYQHSGENYILAFFNRIKENPELHNIKDSLIYSLLEQILANAIKQGHIELITVLLKEMTSESKIQLLNASLDEENHTALHLACLHLNDLIGSFISKGGSVTALNLAGKTPILLIAENRFWHSISYFPNLTTLPASDDLSRQYAQALLIASRENQQEAVKSLIEKNAATTIVYEAETNYSFIHYLVLHNDITALRILLSKGSYLDLINIRDQETGITPLMLCVIDSKVSVDTLDTLLQEAGPHIDLNLKYQQKKLEALPGNKKKLAHLVCYSILRLLLDKPESLDDQKVKKLNVRDNGEFIENLLTQWERKKFYLPSVMGRIYYSIFKQQQKSQLPQDRFFSDKSGSGSNEPPSGPLII